MVWFFAVYGVAAALTALNARRPTQNQYLMIFSFFSGWLNAHLAEWRIVIRLAVAAWAVGQGALDHAAGWVGLAGIVLSVLVLASISLEARKVPALAEAALADSVGGQSLSWAKVDGDRARWKRRLVPFRMKDRRVKIIRNVVWARGGGRDLRLDITMPRDQPDGAPVLLQIHGGAFVSGFKDRQSQPLQRMLAARGWVCVNIDYRLSPAATYPDHLVDCKRAVAWIRDNIATYGGDPDRVFATGGSAGGHLCLMLALTADDPSYQPGFEDVDCSVLAAAPYYSIYDLTNRLGTMPSKWITHFMAPTVMKTGIEDDPELYRRSSPIDRVCDTAPPMLVIHGDRDNLTPVEDARLFVERLRACSPNPVGYLEVPGAHHAFDIFYNRHGDVVLEAVIRFFEHWASVPPTPAGSAQRAQSDSSTH